MGAEAFEAYFAFLDTLGGTLDRLTALLKETTAAASRGDLMTVNECMNREQALGLSLRSMDRKRESMLAGLGLSGVPLSGLADHCPAELRPRARRETERLRKRYGLYTAAADVARTTLEINLHEVEKIMRDHYGGIPDTVPPHGGQYPGRGAFADIRA